MSHKIYRGGDKYDFTAGVVSPEYVDAKFEDNADWLKGKNLFDKNNLAEKNKRLSTNGSPVNADMWGYSFIPIESGKTYTISGQRDTSSGAINGWYDENKQYISTINLKNVSAVVTATAPNNAKYMGISTVYNYAIGVQDIDTIQVEEGEVATAYEPFHGMSNKKLSELANNLGDELANKASKEEANYWAWKKLATVSSISASGTTINLNVDDVWNHSVKIVAYNGNVQYHNCADYSSSSGRIKIYTMAFTTEGKRRVIELDWANATSNPNSCVIKIYENGTAIAGSITWKIYAQNLPS